VDFGIVGTLRSHRRDSGIKYQLYCVQEDETSSYHDSPGSLTEFEGIILSVLLILK
jgi:hypothetical protein